MPATSPAAPSGQAAAQAAENKTARRLTGLRRNSVAISVMLLFQCRARYLVATCAECSP